MHTNSPSPDEKAPSILDGAQQLLIDAIGVLEVASCQDYIVIGGWCPYLRNKTSVQHPGTLDVDLLFKEGNAAQRLGNVVRAFVDGGFIPSAKHSFQLLREQKLDGMSLIYNVDLLHPRIGNESNGMFVDHLDLDLRLTPTGVETKKLKSIVQPNSAVLFEQSLYSTFSLKGVAFNLVTFTGMLLTKVDSCQKAKRERDSFDIYLAALNDDIDIHTLQIICDESESVLESMRGFDIYLSTKANVFDTNVRTFGDVPHQSPAKFVQSALSKLSST